MYLEENEFPDGWKINDVCIMVTNKKKKYTAEYTVLNFDGKYFGVKSNSGNYHRVAPSRMFRSKEEAVASLNV